MQPFESQSDPFEEDKPAAPAYQEPVPVTGIPYLVDAVVEAKCPGGADCPVVVVSELTTTSTK